MKILDVPQSGSLGGVTSSRNRFGQYRRSRSTPINPNSANQAVVRSRMSLNAAAWRDLTANQRAGWGSLGSMMTRADSLGQAYTLSGFQAFLSVNNNRLCAGDAVATDAPALSTPDALATATLTLTAASFSLAYTVTPLPTGTKLLLFASPQRSAGRNYEGDYRLIKVSSAAAASPLVALTEYTARLGVPVVGNKIFLMCHTYFAGFLSSGYGIAQVVA